MRVSIVRRLLPLPFVLILLYYLLRFKLLVDVFPGLHSLEDLLSVTLDLNLGTEEKEKW